MMGYSVKWLLRDGQGTVHLDPIYVFLLGSNLSNLPVSSGSHPKCPNVMAAGMC